MSNNLKIWNQVEKSVLDHTKKVAVNQRKFTAIDAQHQIKRATELFGPFGKGWGIANEQFITFPTSDPNALMVLYQATMWWRSEESADDFSIGEKKSLVPPGSNTFAISSSIKSCYKTSSGYIKVDDDFAKKLSTDAITKGLSRMGFNSDIFEGRFEDNKYIAQLEKEALAEAQKETKEGSQGNKRETTTSTITPAQIKELKRHQGSHTQSEKFKLTIAEVINEGKKERASKAIDACRLKEKAIRDFETLYAESECYSPELTKQQKISYAKQKAIGEGLPEMSADKINYLIKMQVTLENKDFKELFNLKTELTEKTELFFNSKDGVQKSILQSNMVDLKQKIKNLEEWTWDKEEE